MTTADGEFLLFQLYNADPAVADRCPHCSRHLGGLKELAARRPVFRGDPATVLVPVRATTMALTQRDEAGAAHHDTDTVRHLRWPWQRHRRAA